MATTVNLPQHSLCPACGHRIVTATTRDGVTVQLDTAVRVYRLILDDAKDGTYRAEAEKAFGYAVHLCRGEKDR